MTMNELLRLCYLLALSCSREEQDTLRHTPSAARLVLGLLRDVHRASGGRAGYEELLALQGKAEGVLDQVYADTGEELMVIQEATWAVQAWIQDALMSDLLAVDPAAPVNAPDADGPRRMT